MEEVVLLNEAGHAIGSADKAAVHHLDTPLHLAFSCYVFSSRNEVLLSRRSTRKKTWPGVWTNSCCGHPAPDEPLASAVRRRLGQELGIRPASIDLVLPQFRYRAVMANGIVENEMCPVFRAYSDADPVPDPEEADDVGWMDWAEFGRAVTGRTFDVSPWCCQQVHELLSLGTVVQGWPIASDDRLPAAARR